MQRKLRQLALVGVIAVGLVLIAPTAASAATIAHVATAAAVAITFSLPPALIVGLVGSVLLPLIVGWVTNSTWSPRGKAILLAALAAISGLVTELGESLTAGTTYDLGLGLITAVGLFLGAVGIHFGFLSRPNAEGVSVSQRLASSGGVTLNRH